MRAVVLTGLTLLAALGPAGSGAALPIRLPPLPHRTAEPPTPAERVRALDAAIIEREKLLANLEAAADAAAGPEREALRAAADECRRRLAKLRAEREQARREGAGATGHPEGE